MLFIDLIRQVNMLFIDPVKIDQHAFDQTCGDRSTSFLPSPQGFVNTFSIYPIKQVNKLFIDHKSVGQ